jgi:hypothetical protein
MSKSVSIIPKQQYSTLVDEEGKSLYVENGCLKASLSCLINGDIKEGWVDASFSSNGLGMVTLNADDVVITQFSSNFQTVPSSLTSGKLLEQGLMITEQNSTNLVDVIGHSVNLWGHVGLSGETGSSVLRLYTSINVAGEEEPTTIQLNRYITVESNGIIDSAYNDLAVQSIGLSKHSGDDVCGGIIYAFNGL